MKKNLKAKAKTTQKPAGSKKAAKGKIASPKAAKPTAARPAAATPAKSAARKANGGDRNRYDWKGAEEKAKLGVMPAAPDFSADTHTRFRPKLEEVVKLAKARDAKGLKAFQINVVSSSPKAIDRFRNLCLMALQAKA